LNEKKSLIKAYLWWSILGVFGAHRLYVGKRKSAFLLFSVTLFWIISLFLTTEPFGIVAFINFLEPVEQFLLKFGQIGRIFSALLFIIILTFPALWWLSDGFRIPRWLKKQEGPSS